MLRKCHWLFIMGPLSGGGEAAARARLLREAQRMQGHAEVETGPRDGSAGGERSW